VVGGALGLSKNASARAFVQPGAFVSDVLNALISDAGETISSTIDSGFMGTNLTAWHTTPRPISQCIQLLVDIVNRNNGTAYDWRVLGDGTVWVGQETWPAATGDFQVIAQNPSDASWELGVESPFVTVGTTIPIVGQVGRVEHVIEPTRIRQYVWQTVPGTTRGIINAIQTIVKQQTIGVDYFGLYEAKVIAQSADGTTLDVQPVDKRFAGTQRVQLRHGLPGMNVQVTPGAKILLGFISGDPSQPYVHSWAGGESVTTLTVKVSNATWISVGPSTMTLGTNLVTTPVLTVGSVDSMGVPVTNCPTNTGTVLSG
jgi:hypothetical protein